MLLSPNFQTSITLTLKPFKDIVKKKKKEKSTTTKQNKQNNNNKKINIGEGNVNPLQYPGKSRGQSSLVGYSPGGHKQ